MRNPVFMRGLSRYLQAGWVWQNQVDDSHLNECGSIQHVIIANDHNVTLVAERSNAKVFREGPRIVIGMHNLW